MTTDVYDIEELHDEVASLRGQVDRLQEAIVMLTSGHPPDAISGDTILYADQAGLPAFVTAAGFRANIPGSQVVFFPGNTVTGTSPANLAAGSYQGGDAGAGSVYDLELWGNGTWGSTAQTLTMSVSFGGTTMSTVTLGTGFMNVSLIFRFRVLARVVCHTTGVSGTWSSLIHGNVSLFNGNLLTSGASSNNPTNSFVSCESTSTTTKDTTASQTLALQASWGSTTGAPTITSQAAFFRRIA